MSRRTTPGPVQRVLGRPRPRHARPSTTPRTAKALAAPLALVVLVVGPAGPTSAADAPGLPALHPVTTAQCATLVTGRLTASLDESAKGVPSGAGAAPLQPREQQVLAAVLGPALADLLRDELRRVPVVVRSYLRQVDTLCGASIP